MQSHDQIGPQRYRESFGRYYDDFTVGDVSVPEEAAWISFGHTINTVFVTFWCERKQPLSSWLPQPRRRPALLVSR